jgi:hypothetical protein
MGIEARWKFQLAPPPYSSSFASEILRMKNANVPAPILLGNHVQLTDGAAGSRQRQAALARAGALDRILVHLLRLWLTQSQQPAPNQPHRTVSPPIQLAALHGLYDSLDPPSERRTLA